MPESMDALDESVHGTPFFMTNEVIDPNAGSYTVDNWEKLINS